MVVYSITNTINGKMYIGQTVQEVSRRFHRHRTGPYAIGNAIRKYGEENFKIDILFNSYDVDMLNEAEKELIASYDTMYPNGYNLMEGGQIRMSPESIEKMRQSKLGHVQPKSVVEARVSKRRRKIICKEDQICFKSIKDAADFYNGDPSHLTKLLKGKCNSFKGRTFAYLKEK